jgi:hypothetical protein
MAAVTKRWAPFSLFYPLSFLTIVGMVILALKPGIERTEAWRTVLAQITTAGLVVEGEDLGVLVASERSSSELVGSGDDRRAVIGSTGLVTNLENYGVRYWLPADAVRALRGHEVEAALEVRSAETDGSEDWLVRVALAGVFDTGWLPQRAGTDWSTALMSVTIPPTVGSEPMEIIMWSDATGDGGRIELRRIEIQPVGPTEP